MSDSVVVDASLVAKWVLTEPYSLQATSLLQSWVDSETRLLAPGLLTSEITNIVYKRVIRSDLTLDEARTALGSILAVEITYVHDPDLSLHALETAAQLGLPAAYDAHYLALAEREDCACWTADERLWNAVQARLSWIHWVGNVADTQE